jgi:hypothetical protein
VGVEEERYGVVRLDGEESAGGLAYIPRPRSAAPFATQLGGAPSMVGAVASRASGVCVRAVMGLVEHDKLRGCGLGCWHVMAARELAAGRADCA